MGVGSSIVTRAGPSVALVAATPGAAQTVYNFEVADYHTYFVGLGEVWVHNTCGTVTLNGVTFFTELGDDGYLIWRNAEGAFFRIKIENGTLYMSDAYKRGDGASDLYASEILSAMAKSLGGYSQVTKIVGQKVLRPSDAEKLTKMMERTADGMGLDPNKVQIVLEFA